MLVSTAWPIVVTLLVGFVILLSAVRLGGSMAGTNSDDCRLEEVVLLVVELRRFEDDWDDRCFWLTLRRRDLLEVFR